MGDFLGGIIDHHREVIGGGDVLAREDEVAEHAGIDFVMTEPAVAEIEGSRDLGPLRL